MPLCKDYPSWELFITEPDSRRSWERYFASWLRGGSEFSRFVPVLATDANSTTKDV